MLGSEAVVNAERDRPCRQHEPCHLGGFRGTLGKKGVGHGNQRRQQAGQRGRKTHLAQRQRLVVKNEGYAAEGPGT